MKPWKVASGAGKMMWFVYRIKDDRRKEYLTAPKRAGAPYLRRFFTREAAQRIADLANGLDIKRNPPVKRVSTLDTFRVVVSDYRDDYPETKYPIRAQWALHAVWWFVENVSQDDPDRNAIFLELHAMVRGAF